MIDGVTTQVSDIAYRVLDLWLTWNVKNDHIWHGDRSVSGHAETIGAFALAFGMRSYSLERKQLDDALKAMVDCGLIHLEFDRRLDREFKYWLTDAGLAEALRATENSGKAPLGGDVSKHVRS